MAEWPRLQGGSMTFIKPLGSWISGKLLLTIGYARLPRPMTPESAHAYWHLFKACADRRAVIWMQTLYQSHATKDERLEAARRRFI